MRSSRLWFALGAATLLLTGACGYPASGPGVEAPESISYDLAAALDDRHGIVGNSETTRAEIAIQSDLAECMSDAGFEYWPEDQIMELDFATRMTTFMFASDAYPRDVDEARAEGFGVGAGLLAAYEDGLASVHPEVPGRVENREYVTGLSPEAQGSYGAAMRTCRETLGDRLEEIMSIRVLAGQVIGAARESAGSHPDYSSMLAGWRSCLSEQEVPPEAGSPEQLRDLVMSWYFEEEGLVETGEPLDIERFRRIQAREFLAAVASVECGADEAFGSRVEAILEDEIQAELTRRGLDG